MTGAPPRLPSACRLLTYDRLGSSNDEARRLAREGAATWTVVWTHEQSAGRGRRGRSWVAVPGNLYASIVLRPDCATPKAAELGFVTAVAVGDAVAGLLPDASRLRLKWPNDLLVSGRKLSGILLESEIGAGGIVDWVVVGIGVNVAGHPAATDNPATSLREEGCASADAAAVLAAVCRELYAWFDKWRAEGFPAIRAAWLSRAALLGETITARFEGGEATGRFVTLDGDGAMLLETAAGVRRITAGDIFLPGG